MGFCHQMIFQVSNPLIPDPLTNRLKYFYEFSLDFSEIFNLLGSSAVCMTPRRKKIPSLITNFLF